MDWLPEYIYMTTVDPIPADAYAAIPIPFRQNPMLSIYPPDVIMADIAQIS